MRIAFYNNAFNMCAKTKKKVSPHPLNATTFFIALHRNCVRVYCSFCIQFACQLFYLYRHNTMHPIASYRIATHIEYILLLNAQSHKVIGKDVCVYKNFATSNSIEAPLFYLIWWFGWSFFCWSSLLPHCDVCNCSTSA